MESSVENAKISPNDIHAEKSVLGAMMIDEEAINAVTELLQAADFYSPNHADIFKAIVELSTKGEPVDFITLQDQLRKVGDLDRVGGLEYLMALSEFVIGATNVVYYAEIVKEKAILRKLIRISDQVMMHSYENKPVDGIVEFAEQSIYEISQNKEHGGLEHVKDLLNETVERINEMTLSDSSLTGISTGLIDLDAKLSGLQKSDLVLLAARPSMGKTSLALNIGLKASLKHYVAIFSLEMSKMQVTQRLISMLSNINLQDIVSGWIDDWTTIGQALNILAEAHLYIDDTSGISLTELRSKARKLKSMEQLDLIVIDYLQLMTSDSGNENRQQEISTISRGLKALAKDLNCPILALSQLSRAPDQRPNHRPVMSDLRESGAIEQDADVVMMLYRDDYYNEDSEKPGTAEVIIAKHRNGPTGTVDVVFDKEHTKFLDQALDYDAR